MPQQDPAPAEAGGSTATTMRRNVPRKPDRQRLDRVALPERVLAILDQLAVQFLPPQPRAAIAPRKRVDEARRQVALVGHGADARQARARIGDQRLQQRHRPRRRRHQLPRRLAQPQAELQHVEGLLPVLPFRQLVAPGHVKLRPAQAFRILGGKDLRHRPVRPDQPAAGKSRIPAGSSGRSGRCRKCRRSSPRAHRPASRQSARSADPNGVRRLPPHAPIPRLPASCRSHARRAAAMSASRPRAASAPAAPESSIPSAPAENPPAAGC